MKTLAIRFKAPRVYGRILDVGSGNNALDIATHLVDRYPENNHERAGNLDLPSEKEFKEGDIESIPYPDRFFDFVHASHVLEHTFDPKKAIQELTRVAHSGYVETPAAALEQGAFLPDYSEPGWNFHRWMVWCFPDHPVLYLKPKTPIALKTTCTCPSAAAYSEIARRMNLIELDRHLPYYCKMTQFLWTSRGPAWEIWSEEQQGHLKDELRRCTCAYSAFFAWGKKYFSSLRQIRRRWIFRKEFPEVFSLYRSACRS